MVFLDGSVFLFYRIDRFNGDREFVYLGKRKMFGIKGVDVLCFFEGAIWYLVIVYVLYVIKRVSSFLVFRVFSE